MMFDPGHQPRVFGLPPGCDFGAAFATGLLARLRTAPPEVLARTVIYVNTRRMQRHLTECLRKDGARLLPKINVISEFATSATFPDIPPAIPPLRRRLTLARLVERLLRQAPDLAPQSALFPLTDSLADLLDEMRGEGVEFDALRNLDLADHSAHWERSLKFLEIVTGFLGENAPHDIESRQRAVIERMIRHWQSAPPDHPVLVAGSTGSRGATQDFMAAVAGLPQGAVILPGFDFDLPAPVWQELSRGDGAEDHAQFRFSAFLARLELSPTRLKKWSTTDMPENPRGRLISLALRPAPVTSQWLDEGPLLGPLGPACAGLDLIEADTPRHEANAIALCLRHALEEGKTAALISPDRNLTRMVTAALDRWGILPDDSAGTPLHLSPPGRFLLLVADNLGTQIGPQSLITILKHPLCNTGGSERNTHLKWTRELELYLRRRETVSLSWRDIRDWAAGQTDHGIVSWLDWIEATAEALATPPETGFGRFLDRLNSVARQLADGPSPTGDSELWKQEAGQEAEMVIKDLAAELSDDPFGLPEFRALLRALLAAREVRSPVQPDHRIRILGTMEARVQSDDLVVLGGLNEGIWPAQPDPDPWLNRRMRLDAGLLLPDRRIGLSAHDFQIAVGSPRVVLTRAVRDNEAETVPSRWLNRITNLLGGLQDTDGPAALRAMKARGQTWLNMATMIDAPSEPIPPAARPCPAPPATARPDRLSVTAIQTLIRDPYAIYARHVLRLRPLDSLTKQPDPRMRGQVMHKLMERFVARISAGGDGGPEAMLMLAEQVFDEFGIWPVYRRLWMARIRHIAGWFSKREAERRQSGTVLALERQGRLTLEQPPFTLTGTADRIDAGPDGNLIIYDYKTGKPPATKQIEHFDRQLLLEACIAEEGGFRDLPPAAVDALIYIGLGTEPVEAPVDLTRLTIADTRRDLGTLIASYQDPGRGYTSRRACLKRQDDAECNHLARYGEWDETAQAVPEPVGQRDA